MFHEPRRRKSVWCVEEVAMRKTAVYNNLTSVAARRAFVSSRWARKDEANSDLPKPLPESNDNKEAEQSEEQIEDLEASVHGEEGHEATASTSSSSSSSSSSASGGQGKKGAGRRASSSSGSAGSSVSPKSSDGSSKDGSSKSLQKPVIPDIYPQVLALPIARRPLFPGFYKAVVIKDKKVTAAIQEMLKRGQPYIGAFLLKDENNDSDVITNVDQVHPVGVFAQITSVFPANVGDDGALTTVLYPHRRIQITSLLPQKDDRKESLADATEGGENHVSFTTSFLHDYDVSLVNVKNLADLPHDRKNNVIRAVTSEIVNVFKEIASINPLFRDQIANFSMSQSAGNVFEEPAKLADFAAAVSAGDVGELQGVLEALSVEARLHKALLILKKELMNAQLQSKISKDVESKIQKRQREYYLLEQMKGIKRELGLESDGKDKLVENFKAKAAKLSMPDGVQKVFEEEINKLAHLEPQASEFNVSRNYLDWLTQIPWGQRTPENYNIKHAITVLDDDHYGLKDVKDRILEFIAVGKLRGTVEGKILCFVGPPGVGKTSIGKSIARALERPFYRFSVGGLTDVAEIKGHRRTYIGAMPGKVAQALKKVQSENPLILIDEGMLHVKTIIANI